MFRDLINMFRRAVEHQYPQTNERQASKRPTSHVTAQIEDAISFALAEAKNKTPAPHLISVSIESTEPLNAVIVFCIGDNDELDEVCNYVTAESRDNIYRLSAPLIEAANELAHRALTEIEKHFGRVDLKDGSATIMIRQLFTPLSGEIIIHDGRRNHIEPFRQQVKRADSGLYPATLAPRPREAAQPKAH
jgi:hypothetical protein